MLSLEAGAPQRAPDEKTTIAIGQTLAALKALEGPATQAVTRALAAHGRRQAASIAAHLDMWRQHVEEALAQLAAHDLVESECVATPGGEITLYALSRQGWARLAANIQAMAAA